MFNKKTVKDVKIQGQIVLMRTDYNVPLENGKVTSDLRIRASLPTINYLLEHGAKKIILISHLGRPDGHKVPELSLKPVYETLKSLLPDQQLFFADDVSGPDVEMDVEQAPNSSIILLENLRFYPGEEKNSEDFAKEIAESTHATLFVQDGFAVVHRAHASTDAITKELPSVAGLLLEKEVGTLTAATENPAHPLLVIIGGSKVADKQPLIDKFMPLAENIAVGGKIAADGYASSNQKIYVAEDFTADAEGHKLDIGEASTAKIVSLIKPAKTIIWNGVLGLVEQPEFAKSSTAVAEAIGQQQGITSIICGGDTAGFVENLQATHPELNYTLVSTGGGAALELLSGLPLPGVEALEDN
ncbi:phosphoglycerate kinase [Candidatus Saccharibacteria bacterium]|nr:phosphoglycerate kinase [Candidatus Saccharibacteria bacterium]